MNPGCLFKRTLCSLNQRFYLKRWLRDEVTIISHEEYIKQHSARAACAIITKFNPLVCVH